MSSENKFQIKCEAALVDLIASVGVAFSAKSLILGNEENYIEGKVLGFKFWIYEDGAEIQTESDEYPFEWQDYKSLNELQDDFISTFRRLLTSESG